MKSYYLAASFWCLLAGCGGPTTLSDTFHLKVERDLTNNDQRQETVVKFHAPPKGEIIVESGGDRSSISFDANDSKIDRECVVRLIAERKGSPTDGKSTVEIIIRPEMPNGGTAGGLSIYTVDANKSLDEILDVTVTESDSALDNPVTLGTLNGVPITLIVRPLRDL